MIIIKILFIVIIIILIFHKKILYYNKIFKLSKLDKFKRNLFRMSWNMKINRLEDDIYYIDNFYADPDMVRKIAFSNNKKFKNILPLYTTTIFNPFLNYDACIDLVAFFEKLSKNKIDKDVWNKDILNESNGYIQFITQKSTPVIHFDKHWGVIIFLHPNPSKNSGTSFYENKKFKINKVQSEKKIIKKYGLKKLKKIMVEANKALWKEGEKSKFKRWRKYLTIDNIYNRAIVFNGHRYHCSDGGFGSDLFDGRLYQTFFFSPNK